MSLLEAKGLTVDFGGLRAVNNLDLAVEPGQIFSLIGPNGAGKTTTFNAITGFVRPSAGNVQFKGRDLVGLKPHQIACIGVVRTFQKTSIFSSLTALENIGIGCHRKAHSNVLHTLLVSSLVRDENEYCVCHGHELLDFVGLDARSDVRASDLSYGEQRLLEVAIGLAAEPELLLLDEPVCGLNPSEAARVMDLIFKIRDKGITILLVEHNMRLVMSISDHVLVLDYGSKIAEGKPSSVSQNEQVIKAYLGEHYAARRAEMVKAGG